MNFIYKQIYLPLLRSLITCGLIALFFTSSVTYAQIHKCVSDNGKINFQDKPCTKGRSEAFKLNKSNVMDENKHLNNYQKSLKTAASQKRTQKENTSAHPSQGFNEIMCKSSREAYNKQVTAIKARCKKGRETFCGKSAEDIQKTWDNNYLKKQQGDVFSAPSQEWYAFNRNGGAPIFQFKAQMKQYCSN